MTKKIVTTPVFKLPTTKVPHRLQSFVKQGGKVFECEWCGTYSKQRFCSISCEARHVDLLDA
jgi:hypothetical protein